MRPLTLAHRIRSRQCLAALALLLSCTGAWAQAGTLDKIKKSGIIALGHREASIPFSYLGDNRQPVGYSVELCQRVAESVKRQLGLAQLNIKWVQVVPENRMEKLISGEIDLECGSTTNTLSRQEQVAFSLLTFADGGSLMMKQGSTLKGLADMGGRTIGVVPGTTTERTLRDALSRHKVKAKTVLLKDHADGVVAVMQGKVDAYASDRVILFGLVLGSGNQKNLRLTEELFSYEPYALMMRKDDPAFRLAVNRELARLYRSEEIYAIYDRWLGVFGTPGPLLKSLYFLNGLPE
ncbi:MAG: amino acid ABC transporter substrate-binding protein [Rhodocyclaceae bacterium]|jgi:ABC-type amino acid transport substrate-binding protein|nr:amino acid ABC transporter substrate-binding protein [Rhodocyclaceae bacterium]MCB1891735.1 amino acid ABC transporter substrate-binding protein [Rhodocyclaceae bacterium]MCO5098870.1 amino acid ABC transporter substrate-binding protein [Rhodocyclaceae bacterium]MCW5596879.1 amino acid ABC transporter substrate-binding protein [Rhodocyclaceae bacterium]PKO70083.1 MAG: amino acid ABC transporter substrate-binding protein [Betaproteobacteria bacterium HGW-Betaproteobacteria-14]